MPPQHIGDIPTPELLEPSRILVKLFENVCYVRTIKGDWNHKVRPAKLIVKHFCVGMVSKKNGAGGHPLEETISDFLLTFGLI